MARFRDPEPVEEDERPACHGSGSIYRLRFAESPDEFDEAWLLACEHVREQFRALQPASQWLPRVLYGDLDADLEAGF